jgi:phosphatidylglycerophosphatase A
MKRLLTSCFGLGWLPVAPGTYGSLPPTIIFGLLYQFGVSSFVTLIVMAIIAFAGSVVCVKFAHVAIEATGKKDPHEVVADELAGQAVTFLFSPFFFIEAASTRQIWFAALLGFALFRLFDIVKPWPIRKLEKLPNGWGILADDLLAGVFAGIGLLVFSLYLHPLLSWSQELQ